MVESIPSTTASNTPITLTDDVLSTLWQKSLAALQSLRSPLGVMAGGKEGPFHAIFGRDSLWTVFLALEAVRLLSEPQAPLNSEDAVMLLPAVSYHDWLHDLATSVLRGLANLQGQVINDANEEQPGRIVHEYWDPVPEQMLQAGWPSIGGRYYGGFDTTFLFIAAAAQVDAYFDDRAFLEELWPHIHAALLWMLEWSDLDHDGLVEYTRRNPLGLGLDNQVWKDSTESIQPRPNEARIHPYAWIEVQGYALAAYTGYIALARKLNRLGHGLHQEIERCLEGLTQGIPRFWLAGEQFPAMALDGQKKPVAVVSSNPGHLLWSGGIDRQEAEHICLRLLQPDMLTPWGIRTLSEQAYYYNPYLYHCGTVWPFDNAITVAGMQRYGFHEEARRVAETILQAVCAIDDPVELYMVLPSRWIRSPSIEQPRILVDYYYASTVQAWTTAAILYLVALLMQSP